MIVRGELARGILRVVLVHVRPFKKKKKNSYKINASDRYTNLEKTRSCNVPFHSTECGFLSLSSGIGTDESDQVISITFLTYKSSTQCATSSPGTVDMGLERVRNKA